MAEQHDDLGISEKVVDSVEELIERVTAYAPSVDPEFIRSTYEFSEAAHAGQIRRSGEPYISHPLAVAGILADLRLDVETIATGLLHDTVEDTEVTIEDIQEKFGGVVAHLVDGVTKITQLNFKNTQEKQGENIRKMIVAMGKDIRVVLVKLADRLHNMRTLNHMPYAKQLRIANETLEIYAPLASRLGISSLKVELEDLSFRFANPDLYYELAQKVAKKKKERERYIDEVKKILEGEIKTRSKLKYEISGRPKHLYSIYKKMSTQNIDYEQVYDVLAFRVFVTSIPECYEVLGIVHSVWKPIPGRFKDYIAMPKANNYQSLHTTVIGPEGERIEIQIRTFEMHEIAERGVAAHWQYKESSVSQSSVEKFQWLRELVSWDSEMSNSSEFLETVKTDLFESEIYVFTPNGEVKELPEGATPLDFAYSIHTEVGSKCSAARVNGRIVPLKHKLKSGDKVEILTSKNQKPSKDWLKYCVTNRAKSKIRAFVKAEQRERAMALGKDLVEKEFRKHGASVTRVFKGELYEKFLKDMGAHSEEEIYIRVGYGRIEPLTLIEKIQPELIAKPETEEEDNQSDESVLKKIFKSATAKKKKSHSLIEVDGMSDVLVHYAKCCNPIPGDPIAGFITRGRGITVHRADCPKAFEMDQMRRVDVEWSGSLDEKAGNERVVCLRITSHNAPGLLKQMTEVFSSQNMDIHNAQIRTTKDQKAVCTFDIGVKDTNHLTAVIADLQKLKGVLSVTRITKS
jgi:guanosine-3',5'-bis(diphosphate) 3'-pyrophosphohydrolase